MEQVEQTVAKIQEQTQKAVADLNTRVLSAAGAKSNEELLTSVQSQVQTYANQIKGVAERIGTQIEDQRDQVGTNVGNLVKQLADSTAKILGNNDPNKVEQIQKTFTSVLDQTNQLQRSVQDQGKLSLLFWKHFQLFFFSTGGAIQKSLQDFFNDNLSKIYENTLKAATSVAQQLDTAVGVTKTN